MRYATLVRDELIPLDPKTKLSMSKTPRNFSKTRALDQAIKEAAQTIRRTIAACTIMIPGPTSRGATASK